MTSSEYTTVKEIRESYGWSRYVWQKRVSVLNIKLFRNQRILSPSQVAAIIDAYGKLGQ